MLCKKNVSLNYSVLLCASKSEALVARAMNERRITVGLYKILDKIGQKCLCFRITCCKAPTAGNIHIGKVGALIKHYVLTRHNTAPTCVACKVLCREWDNMKIIDSIVDKLLYLLSCVAVRPTSIGTIRNKADREAIDEVLGHNVEDDSIRDSFLLEDEDGNALEEDEDDLMYDPNEDVFEDDGFFGDDE